MIADIEEFGQMDASELDARRLNAKEVLTPMKGENFMFPVADGTVNPPGGDPRLKPSTSIRDHLERGEEQEVFRGETDGLSSPTHIKMTQNWMMRELNVTSGLLREISFIAITWNSESNCTCRKKKHFLFR